MPPALQVEALSKSFRVYRRKTQSLVERLLMNRRSDYERLPALREVSFEVEAGTLLGLIGRNGSGKSTLLKVLAGIYRPERGRFIAQGRMAGLLELGAGFHPELTGRENIFLNGSILGIPASAIRQRFEQIVEFSGLEDYLETPIKQYSSGMVVRLGFSVAMAAEPDILLVDEVLGVGDAAFALKSVRTIQDLVHRGKTVIFVSHDLPLVTSLAQQVLWLEAGELKGQGPPEEIVRQYLTLLTHQGDLEANRGWTGGARATPEAAPVQVAELHLRNLDGIETTLFSTGEAMHCYFRLEASEPVEGAFIQLGVEGLRGETILGPLTTELPPFEEGTVAGAFRIQELPLNKGEYVLTLAVWDRNLLRRYTPRPATLRFTVGKSRNPDIAGPWDIPGRWEWT